ncbi:ribonuclease T2 family protein [Ferrimonas marina]|uniref:ribonuclease T2 family protein n=1 Tax=Ferrimonas marina TaxID=299255 RepID=UPI0013566EDB|nr:hypothetical protein [Ferrimonas marina]
MTLIPGQAYPILAENRPQGEWWLVRVGDQRRWVSKACGERDGAATEPAQTATTALAQAPTPAGFSHYTLAMSWHSGFCASQGQRPDCRSPQANLVLHGLWPSGQPGRHPEYCDGSQRQRFCQYDSLGLPQGQWQALQQVMPGTQVCLGRYQWHKHGSCSGLAKGDYFELAIGYSHWLRSSEPARQLRSVAGTRVSRARVLGWFEQWGAKDAVSLHCRDGVLQEVRLNLVAQLPATPGPTSLLPASLSQRCPSQFEVLP